MKAGCLFKLQVIHFIARGFVEMNLTVKNPLEKLDNLAADYDLELDDFITTFDEGKEVDLDD